MIKKKKVIELAKAGLGTDGGHHKQWYLEQILKELGVKDKEIQATQYIYGTEAGIPP